MRFPTGGRVRERCEALLNRLDSGTDSTVWMEEDERVYIFMVYLHPDSDAPELYSGVFFARKASLNNRAGRWPPGC